MSSTPTSIDEGGDADIHELNLDLDPLLIAFLEQYDALDEVVAAPLESIKCSAAGSNTVETNKRHDINATGLQPPKKKSWSQRQREEMTRLREEMKSLSSTLLEYRKAKANRLEHLSNPNIWAVLPQLHGTSADSEGEMALAWEKVATWECVRLGRSMEENAALYESVRRHKFQAEVMLRTLKELILQEAKLSRADITVSDSDSDAFGDFAAEFNET
ncbi:hypothetical protein KRP22_013135 [Phytophthora ramorum]|nr:hypothetical protein KRP22_11079 [Phytophthora ramorum]